MWIIRKVNFELFGRSISAADIELLVGWGKDLENQRYVGPGFLKLSSQEFWRGLICGSATTAVSHLMLTETGAPVGLSMFYHVDVKERVALTGTLVGSNHNWGRGYGHAIKCWQIKYAISDLGLETLLANVLSSNFRALSMLKRVGYLPIESNEKSPTSTRRNADLLTLRCDLRNIRRSAC